LLLLLAFVSGRKHGESDRVPEAGLQAPLGRHGGEREGIGQSGIRPPGAGKIDVVMMTMIMMSISRKTGRQEGIDFTYEKKTLFDPLLAFFSYSPPDIYSMTNFLLRVCSAHT